ncbi:RDD family protein [Cognatilysobacter segetis]|uniref:RDD family protein n=1 Tax=Cognatilysobacter segetis TaxID=2492394 RepID=UPI0010608848|nr:RDD family protein [Lysobacter segetis]
MTAWYYSDTDRNRLGPVAASDLAELHRNGPLQPGTLVWREGFGDWIPWHRAMDEVLGPRAPSPAAAPSNAAASLFALPADEPGLAVATGYNPYQVVDRVAASPYAPPAARLEDQTLLVQGGEVVYAGFWKRVAAYFIDLFIVVVASAFVGGIIGATAAVGGARGTEINWVVQLLTSLGGLLYFIAFHASRLQATPGKLAIGIKVARPDGRRIGVGRTIGRYFATILSSLVLMIGYVMAGFTDRKQALHDMVCDTVVVDRWAFTAHPERQRPGLGAVAIAVIAAGVVLTLLALVAFAGLVAAFAGMAR